MLIDRPDALERFAAEARGVETIGVDVEGDGLFRYRARLCTVQVCAGEAVGIVDTLAVDAKGALGELLGPDGPEKVLHDAAFDARLLRDVGVTLARVYDTAVAARFLGEKSTGLAALLAARFGLVVSKEQQQSDWGKRPLDDDALVYLADDVRHLGALAAVLREDARQKGIEAEIDEETRYVLARAALAPPAEPPPWTRIKGARDLPPGVRAVLREVTLVREEAAKRFDLPPFKVIGNEALVGIARKRPRTPADLAAIPGAAAGRARALSGELLTAVRRGALVEDAPEEELRVARPPEIPREERDRRRKRDKALSEWRRREAAERGVDAQVVLPGHCLNDLAVADPGDRDGLCAIAGLGEHRVERYGTALLAALAAARGS